MGYEIDFLPVGDTTSGDAICIRYGTDATGYTIHVVDGGYTDDCQKIINLINSHYGAPTFIDHVVLTHADGDHACGLIGVLEHFSVGALWMNRPWLYAEEVIGSFHSNYTVSGLKQKIRDAYPFLVELEEIADKNGIPICETFQGSPIGAFTVLAPSRARYLELIPQFDKTPTAYAEATTGIGGIFAEMAKAATKWIQEAWGTETLSENPEPTSASNESCVVQIASFEDSLTLLTADAGPEGLTEAAQYAQVLGSLSPPSFVQVPHHGSRRNVTPTVLDTWLGTRIAHGAPRRGIAFCSAGKNDADHPRKKVVNAFTRRGYQVHTTEGSTKHHFSDMPDRGWSKSEPKPFYNQVED